MFRFFKFCEGVYSFPKARLMASFISPSMDPGIDMQELMGVISIVKNVNLSLEIAFPWRNLNELSYILMHPLQVIHRLSGRNHFEYKNVTVMGSLKHLLVLFKKLRKDVKQKVWNG